MVVSDWRTWLQQILLTISVRVDCKIQTADSVDNQRKSRLWSIDFTDSSTVLQENCRKSQEQHQVTRGQNWIQRQYRGETKPSKHRFRPSEQIRRTSWQVRLSEVASLCVSTAFKHLSGAVPTTIFFETLTLNLTSINTLPDMKTISAVWSYPRNLGF